MRCGPEYGFSSVSCWFAWDCWFLSTYRSLLPGRCYLVAMVGVRHAVSCRGRSEQHGRSKQCRIAKRKLVCSRPPFCPRRLRHCRRSVGNRQEERLQSLSPLLVTIVPPALPQPARAVRCLRCAGQRAEMPGGLKLRGKVLLGQFSMGRFLLKFLGRANPGGARRLGLLLPRRWPRPCLKRALRRKGSAAHCRQAIAHSRQGCRSGRRRRDFYRCVR